MEKITHIQAELTKLAVDETVTVSIQTEHGYTARVTLPTGISVGAGEASLVNANEAVSIITNVIAPAIIGRDCLEQREIDLLLMSLDETTDRSKLGANSLLPVSLAISRVAAAALHKELYEYIAQLTHSVPQIPDLVSVLIEGGKHGKCDLLLAQELSLIGQRDDITMFLNLIESLFKKRGIPYELGAEGGIAPAASDETVIEVLQELLSIQDNNALRFALDLAATHSTVKQVFNIYEDKLPIALVEDPCPDNDLAAWAAFTQNYGHLLIVAADDLAVGNPTRIKEAVQRQLANCLVVKLNQTATLSELFDIIALTQMGNWKHMISHRGNEVDDDYIIDLAVGTGAQYLKIGTPKSTVRASKFKRYDCLKNKLQLSVDLKTS